MTRTTLSLTLLFLAASSLPLRAIEVSINPVADSTVDAINPTATDSNGQLLTAAEGAFGQPATVLSFVYTQFTLPNGLTGQDFGTINSVDLQFSRANPNTPLALTYYAYGIFDGFDFGSADNYTWNDGMGFFPENTEIRGFGDVNEISYYSDPAESSFIGTLSSSPSGDPTLPFGLNPAQTQTSRDNFSNLLKNDTDGKITIFTKVRQNFGVTSLAPFESIEDVNEFTGPPTLIFDYSEPLDGDFDRDGDIDGNDFLEWQRGNSPNSLSATDLMLWQNNYAPGPLVTLASVPEPTSCCTAILGILMMSSIVRNRARYIHI